MLTPLDIETVEFKKVALGFSPDEVDDFLDKVIVEFERLYKENIKLNDKVNILDEGIKYYKDLEDTIRNSIVRAEKTADDMKYNANISAEQIIKGAELKATEILQEANKRLYELECEIARVQNQYNGLKAKLKMLLETELELLEQSSGDYEQASDEAAVTDEE